MVLPKKVAKNFGQSKNTHYFRAMKMQYNINIVKK